MATDTKSKSSKMTKTIHKLSGDDRRRAKERAKATEELRDSLATTARAASHTAEVLAADVTASAQRATSKAKANKRHDKSSGGKLPKPVLTAAAGLAAGLLFKWLRGRRTKTRET